MQRIVLALAFALCGSVVVAADPEPATEPALLNNPTKTVVLLREVIKGLDPSYESFWDWQSGRFAQGASASLYTFESRDIPIASVRLGWATGNTFHGGLGVDLPGVTKRYVPEMIKGIATVQPLGFLWGLVGKYGRVALVGGYSWDESDPAYGVTFGAGYAW